MTSSYKSSLSLQYCETYVPHTQPIPFALPSPPQVPPSILDESLSFPINKHPIINRSKANIVDKKQFSVNIAILLEPSCYKEAQSILEWDNVMKVEFEALVRNKTWTLVPKPLDCKPITTKWLYKVKLKSDSSLDKHKSRVFARGYKQKYVIDYSKTFSLVPKSSYSPYFGINLRFGTQKI